MTEFEILVEQYEPMIFKVMKSLNIYKNQEEFYQIALIALWEASERFVEGRGSFLNYAYSYVKGRMMTELTRHNRHNDVVYYPSEDFWHFVVDDREVTDSQELETLLSYCDGLTDRERRWVVYHFFYGLKQSQIAPLEGVTIHAVQKWRSSALRKLRARNWGLD